MSPKKMLNDATEKLIKKSKVLGHIREENAKEGLRYGTKGVYTNEQRVFFSSTSETEARRIWKANTGKRFLEKWGSAVTWCMHMNYLTLPVKCK